MYIAKEVQFIGLIQGAAGVAGLALGFWLIPSFGVVGAALSLVLSYAILIALQHGWNRKRGYLDVEYEWTRLVRFACFYCAYAAVALWQRNSPLAVEIGISAVLLAAIPAGLYGQLTGHERDGLWTLRQRFVSGKLADGAARP
jgi:O-antigen/teichoic acid export membrane protein